MNIASLKIGICGLGLIGGSLAKALRFKCGCLNISALEPSAASLADALEEGVIRAGSTSDYSVFTGMDIVFVSTPIAFTAESVRKIALVTQGLISDTSSTKAAIMEQVPEGARFIGGHPMAGSEKGGYKGASELLFENAVYAVCAPDDALKSDIELLSEIVKGIGALPVFLKPEEHDLAVGAISHLPHVLAASLVNFVCSSDPGGIKKRLAAGGFRDMTRIASSDPGLWEQILLSSGGAALDTLKSYTYELNAFIDILARKDGEALKMYLNRAQESRNGIAENRRGLIPSAWEIFVEVSDRPGIIGEIATILGGSGINIKNLHIENNRDYEGGCMRISLGKASDSAEAVSILRAKGFSCRVK